MKKMVSVLLKLCYGPVLFIFSLSYLPKFISRLGQADDRKRMFRERFGKVTNPFSGQELIWIHAVSVGEVLATRELIRMIHVAHPDFKILLTTTTPTGQSLAKKMESNFLRAAYFPMDFKFAVKRFLNVIHPKLILIMETELWPNLISEAFKRKIPMGVINGRISERAMKRYRWVQEWFGGLMNQLRFFLVCTERDRGHFLALGVLNEKVMVTGNMKFDIEANRNALQSDELRMKWGAQNALILVAGSTHEGEEAAVLKIFHELLSLKTDIKLVLAPRHIERALQVKCLAESMLGCKVAMLSEQPYSGTKVLILDAMGELSKFYGIADLVFIGGSLIPHGGQNPIEAARERRAILHGPHVQNFRDIYAQLDCDGGAILVKNNYELLAEIKRLVGSKEIRTQLGARAFEVVDALRGASQRNLEQLERWLNDSRSV